MRQIVRIGQRHGGRQPHVQIEKHMIRRAARANVMTADHAGYGHDDALEIGIRDHDPIAQDRRGGAGNLIPGVPDEDGDDQRGQRIEDRQPRARARQRRNHGHRAPHVAARLQGVGQQYLAGQPSGCARLVPDDKQIDADGDEHDGEARQRNLWQRRAAAQVIKGVAQDLEHHEQQEDRDGSRGNRFVLAMPVWVVVVGWAAGGADADQTDDIGRRVGQRMKAVRENADGAARVAERNLGERDAEVEEEDAEQDGSDGGVAIGRDWGLGIRDWGRGADRVLSAHESHSDKSPIPNP